MIFMRRAALLVLALFACAVFATPQQFGTRTLDVPNPEGFEPLSSVSPRFIQAAQAYLPASNRLIEAYATPADAKALEQGQGADLGRYFQLQVARRAEGLAVSESDFHDASKEMENSFEATLKSTDASQYTDKGNAQVKRMTANDPKIALSGLEYLGVFRREPWGLFFTIKSGLSAGGSTPQTLVCGGALVLVNYQLVFLYSYSHYRDDRDRKWVEGSVSAWADDVRGANPNDPKVGATAQPISGGGILRGIGRMTLMGALIGGLIGLVAWLISKSRRS